MKQILFFVLIFIGLLFNAKAEDKELKPYKFGLTNSNFVWNNEYFNPITKGYTLIGYFLAPKLGYTLSPNLDIEGGVYLLKYSGHDDFSDVLPIYSVKYHEGDLTFVLGTLKGTVYHGLDDVLLAKERYFTHLENGLELTLVKKAYRLDIWLDWRHYLFKGEDDQELLNAGFASNFKLFQNEEWLLDMPISLLVEHRGGQIDTSDKNIKTVSNYSSGVNITKNLDIDMLDKLSFTARYFGFKDSSPKPESIYTKGYSYKASARAFWGKSFMELAYYKADRFLSILGHPIYQCFSETGKHAKTRELLVGGLFLDHEIKKSIDLSFTVEGFYDQDTQDFDYTTGIVLDINF